MTVIVEPRDSVKPNETITYSELLRGVYGLKRLVLEEPVIIFIRKKTI